MDPEDVTNLTQEETTELLLKAWAGHEKLLTMLKTAWGIIANMNWDAPGNSPGMKGIATRWRDEYYALLREETLPVEESEDTTRMLSSAEVWSLVQKEKEND